MDNNTNISNLEFYYLTQLHDDLEKQFLRFDEILPFEQQTTAKIYSPRILNMMLVCCPQIESFVNLITRQCSIERNEILENGRKRPKSIPKLIREINSDHVLSKFEIFTKKNDFVFTPFTNQLQWWTKYADLKHGLATKQKEIDYDTLMNALAALAGLRYLADEVLTKDKNRLEYILEHKYWHFSVNSIDVKTNHFRKTVITEEFPFETMLFKMRIYFVI